MAATDTAAIKLYKNSDSDKRVGINVLKTTTSLSYNLQVNGTANISGALSASSLSLTTALPVNQGGTGATTAAGARTELGAAASSHTHGAGDITSGTLAVARGGTGQTTAANAINYLLQNGCTAGTSDPVDGDTYIASYADGKNSAGTGTNTFHRRPVEKLWNYINGKASSVYAATSHTHNYAGSSSAGGAATNVNLTSTTGTGTSYYITFATGNSGSQTLRANDHFYVYDTASETWINSGKSGRMGGVTLWNGSYYNNLAPNGSLTANRTITFPNATGTVSLEGHTHSYAGSSSAGGSATSAVKLDTSAGSAKQPVYFSGGKPVACTTLTSLATGKGYGFADFTLSGAAASYKYLIMFGYVVSGAARVSTIIPMDQISTTELQFQIADYNNSYRSVGIKKSGDDIIFSSTNGYAKSGSSFDVYGGI